MHIGIGVRPSFPLGAQLLPSLPPALTTLRSSPFPLLSNDVTWAPLKGSKKERRSGRKEGTEGGQSVYVVGLLVEGKAGAAQTCFL